MIAVIGTTVQQIQQVCVYHRSFKKREQEYEHYTEAGLQLYMHLNASRCSW